MKTPFAFLVVILGLSLVTAAHAEDANFVPLGGHYKGGTGFNTAKNPYAYMPTTGSIMQITREQYERNREAFKAQNSRAQAAASKVAPSKPLLNPPTDPKKVIDPKKSSCLSGNYNDCY